MHFDGNSVVAATFYLMSRYTQKPSVEIALKITEHLNILVSLPEYQNSATLVSTCEKLIDEWHKLSSPKKLCKQCKGPVNARAIH